MSTRTLLASLRVGILVPLILLAGNVNALSCVSMELNYHAYCEKSVCTTGFVVEEVHTSVSCGRRKEVYDIQPWMLDLMSEHLRSMSLNSSGKLVRMSMALGYWSRLIPPASRTEYDALIQGRRFRMAEPPKLIVDSERAIQADLGRLRQSEESVSRYERWVDIGLQIADWIVLAGVLIGIVWSVIRYRRLVMAGKKQGRSGLLGVQMTVFFSGLLLILLMTRPLFVFAAPMILFLIWPYQIALATYWRWRSRRPDLTSISSGQ